MATSFSRTHRSGIAPGLFHQAKTSIRQGVALSATLLLTVSTFAQQTAVPSPPDSDNSPVTLGAGITVAIPAGTRIALILTQPIQTRYLHHGDDVYAQTTSPVAVGSEVVIPPGTFVQGKFDRLDRSGSRGELHLQSMGITFPNGYVAPVAGPIVMQTDEGYALKDPGKGRIAAMFALPAAGLGLGTILGHSFGHSASLTTTNTCGLNINCLPQVSAIPDTKLRDTAIGGGVGLAVGGIAAFALVLNSHHFYLDQGSPVEMILQQPLTIDVDQLADAAQQPVHHSTPDSVLQPSLASQRVDRENWSSSADTSREVCNTLISLVAANAGDSLATTLGDSPRNATVLLAENSAPPSITLTCQ